MKLIYTAIFAQISSVKIKKLSEKKLVNCCKFRKFTNWPQTSLNVPTRCGIRKNSSLPNLQIFEICKIVPKIAKCINVARNKKKLQVCKFQKFAKQSQKLPNALIRGEIQKNLSLRNWKMFLICKIISQFAKCADSWRNITEKSKLATRDTFATHSRMRSYKQLTISREI